VRLRGKILLATVLAPVVLALGTLWIVNRRVSEHVDTGIVESLRRSSSAFENLLEERSRTLSVAARVIVRDPRFFSVVAVPASYRDRDYRRTVAGVASDFDRITDADVFEVLDRRGRLLASVGRVASTPAARKHFVETALKGCDVSAILPEDGTHFQATAFPILAGGERVGVLLLGMEIGQSLARELRILTHSQVSFVSGGRLTGTTLVAPEDREALLGAVLAILGEQGSGGKATRVHELRIGSQDYLTLLRPIPASGPAAQSFYVMQRSVDSERAFLFRLQAVLSRLAVLAVLAALVVGLVVAARITGPILRLVRGAEEMERGNYQFPLETTSDDEVGYLVQRFREMRDREYEYVRTLREVAQVKSEFIDVASHELRTPVTTIKGYVDLLSQEVMGPLTPKQREAILAVEASLAGLIRITEDATRVAEIAGDEIELRQSDCDVEALLRETIEGARASAPERRLELSATVEPGMGPARVDPRKVQEALAILVRNGIRFTPDDGYVRVSARREGAELVIEVADSGVGIPEEKQLHLFERSFLVRGSAHHHSSRGLDFNSAGLGLGLSIAKGIVEAHGGTIGVSSGPGKGSVFAVRLPWAGILSFRTAA
jgi:signal transduction histidine kinase